MYFKKIIFNIDMNNKNVSEKEDNIELIYLFQTLFKNKELIFKVTSVFFLIGIIYSISLDNIYRASSTFYPHYENVDNSNNIRNLAGLAGINLEMQSSNNIPSNLYPKIVGSPIFKKNT